MFLVISYRNALTEVFGRMWLARDVIRFSGPSANHTIQSGTFRPRAKVCGQKRQNARLEPRRRQNAAGFNSKGFGVRLTGPGAHTIIMARAGG
jgi:hypothetical protein